MHNYFYPECYGHCCPSEYAFLQDYHQLYSKYLQLFHENQNLKLELDSIKQETKISTPKKKRTRRAENQLSKHFQCPYRKCKKQYASELALNLHIKLKHAGGTKTQRDILVDEVIRAEKQGRTPPKININLPPNYIQKIQEQQK